MKRIAILGPIPRDHIVTHQGDLIQKWGCVTHPVVALSVTLAAAVVLSGAQAQIPLELITVGTIVRMPSGTGEAMASPHIFGETLTHPSITGEQLV